ncbi:hypothetical protein MMC22_005015 [Lobaria immixta]|nr:hypothetical protein [Lobaria immixta]
MHHSGDMLYEYPDFDRWNELLCGELNLPWGSRDVLREQFTLEDLNYHYLKYRHRIEGQNHLNTDDNAKQRLIKALGKLPQIDSIEFVSGDGEPEEDIMDQKPWSFLTAIGRETLSESCSIGGFEHHNKQFVALVQAASQSCKNLTTIKGVGLEWEIFDEPNQLRTIFGAVKHVQHLVLEISNFPMFDTEGHRRKLAQVIADARDIKTLKLCFGELPMERSDHVMKLHQLLRYRSRWPVLQRLVLEGFNTTEYAFKRFLKSHAASLKFLGISNMEFPLLGDGDTEQQPTGSIVSLIKFLQFSLNLEHVEFSGTLCNHWDEGWVVNWDNEFTHDEHCLRSRIQRFIVHGGDCPLQRDEKGKDDEDDEDDEYDDYYDDGWEHYGDRSWRYEPRLMI